LDVWGRWVDWNVLLPARINAKQHIKCLHGKTLWMPLTHHRLFPNKLKEIFLPLMTHSKDEPDFFLLLLFLNN